MISLVAPGFCPPPLVWDSHIAYLFLWSSQSWHQSHDTATLTIYTSGRFHNLTCLLWSFVIPSLSRFILTASLWSVIIHTFSAASVSLSAHFVFSRSLHFGLVYLYRSLYRYSCTHFSWKLDFLFVFLLLHVGSLISKFLCMSCSFIPLLTFISTVKYLSMGSHDKTPMFPAGWAGSGLKAHIVCSTV